eukprot:1161452-Pelagomonas_calceolata.AAC.5
MREHTLEDTTMYSHALPRKKAGTKSRGERRGGGGWVSAHACMLHIWGLFSLYHTSVIVLRDIC